VGVVNSVQAIVDGRCIVRFSLKESLWGGVFIKVGDLEAAPDI
jgi:hypothetical protein